MPADQLRQLAMTIRDRIGRGVVVLGSTAGGKGSLVAAVTSDLAGPDVSAGSIIGDASRKLGGGGSRDPELAQAGGPDGSALETALDTAREAASRALHEA